MSYSFILYMCNFLLLEWYRQNDIPLYGDRKEYCKYVKPLYLGSIIF